MNFSTSLEIGVVFLASSCLVLILRPDLLAVDVGPLQQETTQQKGAAKDKQGKGEGKQDQAAEIRNTIVDLANPRTRKAAELRLVKFGDAAIPFLVGTLTNQNENIREMSVSALKLLSAHKEIAAALNDKSQMIRNLAVTSLLSLGEPGFQTLLAKISVWDKKDIDVVVSLIRESPVEVVSMLIPELANKAPRIKACARLLIKSISPTEGFADALRHHQAKVRSVAEEELAAAGPAALKALSRIIDHHDGLTRGLALKLLTAIGPQSSKAISKLMADRVLCEDAARALVTMGEAGVRSLTETIHELTPATRTKLLPELLPRLESNVIYLLRCLNDGNERTGTNAAELLVSLENEEAILKAFTSSRPIIRRHLAKCIGSMEKKGIPILEHAIENSDQEVRRIAFDSLVKLKAMKSIVKVLDGRSTELRTRGIVALIGFGDEGILSLSKVPGIADDKNLGFSLKELRQHKKSIHTQLERALSSSRSEVYETSLRLLEKAEACRALLRATKHPREAIRKGARKSLLRIGPRAVRDILVSLSETPDAKDTLHIDLLRSMGKAAVPEIMKALKDEKLRPVASKVLQSLVNPGAQSPK